MDKILPCVYLKLIQRYIGIGFIWVGGWGGRGGGVLFCCPRCRLWHQSSDHSSRFWRNLLQDKAKTKRNTTVTIVDVPPNRFFFCWYLIKEIKSQSSDDKINASLLRIKLFTLLSEKKEMSPHFRSNAT